MTNLENKEALEYLKNRLKRMKIADRLKRMGIELGSTVIIGNLVFELLE
jgi:Obg family GTPase CgtA-like protein